MIQTSFLAVFLSSDIYGRPMLIQLTNSTMTACWFHPTSHYSELALYVLAKDGVSVGCLFVWTLFSI